MAVMKAVGLIGDGFAATAALFDVPLMRIADRVAPLFRFLRALLAVWLVTLGLWWVVFGNVIFGHDIVGRFPREAVPPAIRFTVEHAPALVRVLSGEAVIVAGLAFAAGVFFELRGRMR